MKLYFAPLEGITTFTYRNTHFEMFGECDEYYAPFISPSDSEKVSRKTLRDIHPEKNLTKVKIQVLTNQVDSFFKFLFKAQELGYDEVNINLGCPSSTVTKKGRGAGFLKNPDEVDRFLYEIFSKTDTKISIKTRSGYQTSNEIEALVKIYNKYPLTSLTVHPRAREDFYKGVPSISAFKTAVQLSINPICYNGNIFSKKDYLAVERDFSSIDGVMIGRGAIKNPAIFREIKGGKRLTTDELIEFTERLMENYYKIMNSEVYTLQKLKEIWCYTLWNFPDEKKLCKEIKKSNKLSDFMAAIKRLPHIEEEDYNGL